MLNHKGEHVIDPNMYSSLHALKACEKKSEVIRILCEGILARRKWSRFGEMSGRKRNSQADTLPCSKINTGTGSSLMREDKTYKVQRILTVVSADRQGLPPFRMKEKPFR